MICPPLGVDLSIILGISARDSSQTNKERKNRTLRTKKKGIEQDTKNIRAYETCWLYQLASETPRQNILARPPIVAAPMCWRQVGYVACATIADSDDVLYR